MDIPNYAVKNKTCLYVITENRPRCLARMLTSLALSTYLPSFVCVVTLDKHTPDTFEVGYAASMLRKHNVRVDFIGCQATSGLAHRKNIAMRYMETFDCEYGLTVDDDMVFEYHTIEDMMSELRKNTDLFAVGPVVLHTNKRGLPRNDQTWAESMVTVEDGIWKWGGHRQGVIRTDDEHGLVPVQHLAGVFLHRFEHGQRYDEAYDRPVYFLHESDFLYGKPVGVVRHAVVHHWPTTTGENLQDSYEQHQEDILKNAQYFAKKHGLGDVHSFSWEGFGKPEVVK